MKIGIICNHRFALPSINLLLNNGLLAGLATPDIVNQNNMMIRQIGDARGIPYTTLKKQTLSKGIKNWINRINADVVLVYSFPYKIPETVLDLPKLGFINFHPSLLPAYRGPDPLFWQIRNGVETGGITAHVMDNKFDTGPVVEVEQEIFSVSDTYGILETKLSATAMRCTHKLLSKIQSSTGSKPETTEQDNSAKSYFSRPTENDFLIKWKEMESAIIINLIRACNPKYEGAVTILRGLPIRILQAAIVQDIEPQQPAGTIESNSKRNGLLVSTTDNKLLSLDIVYVQEGCFTGRDFKKLFGIKDGERFS